MVEEVSYIGLYQVNFWMILMWSLQYKCDGYFVSYNTHRAEHAIRHKINEQAVAQQPKETLDVSQTLKLLQKDKSEQRAT